MKALLSYYQVGRFCRTFLSACLEALHIIDSAVHPYAVAIWHVLSSPEALALYRFLWRLFLAIAALLMYAAFTAGIKVGEWCDQFVKTCLAPAVTPEQLDQLDQPTAKNETVAAIEPEPWDAPMELTPTKTLTPSFTALLPALSPAKEPVVTVEAKQPKKRGRPKGSKNSLSVA